MKTLVLLIFVVTCCLAWSSQDEQSVAEKRHQRRRSSREAFELDSLYNANRQTRDLASNVGSSKYCPLNQQVTTCDTTSKYRSYDGSCNNLQNTRYGMKNMPYKRVLAPKYDDNLDSPRSLAANGGSLPNVRNISLTIAPPHEFFNSTKRDVLNSIVSNLFTHFGQFLAHDISQLSTTVDSNGIEIECGSCTDSTSSACMPIPVINDQWLGNNCNDEIRLNSTQLNQLNACISSFVSTQTCMNFTRSSASFSDLACTPGKAREQVNLLSAYLDGSQVYGMDEKRAQRLRNFTGGLMNTSPGVIWSQIWKFIPKGMIVNYTATGRDSNSPPLDYLPLDKASNRCGDTTCFLGGEDRASENAALLSVQTLFLREHNRIAKQLAILNPTWSDETLYQETRRIVIAVIQHVTFNEYLPILLPNTNLKSLTTGFYQGYDPSINATIYNEFATAAFRFGHSLIRHKLNPYHINYNQTSGGFIDHRFMVQWFSISDMIFNNKYVFYPIHQQLHGILEGIMYNEAWQFGKFAYQMQNLFNDALPNGEINYKDLLAINIQRGRDHGLPGYTQYLKYYFGVTIKSFSDLCNIKITNQQYGINNQNIMSCKNQMILSQVYKNVDDIDLYAGGYSEKPLAPVNTIGPTFLSITMQQFEELKNGDRFYYENDKNSSPYPFTTGQLKSIRNVTLAGLLCNNYDLLYADTFAFVQMNDAIANYGTSQEVTCDSLMGQLDLTNWKNTV